MDLIWKGSIKRKLMRISMLTTCVALLLTSVLLIANEVMTFRQSLIERMGMMAKIIGTNSTAALMFNDKKTAQETLYALKSGKNITCAILYDRKEMFWRNTFAMHRQGTAAITKSARRDII